MKRIIGYILAVFIAYNLQAQVKVERSPFNQEFVEYVKMQKTTGIKKSSNGHGMGYVPSPKYLHFNTSDVNRFSKKSAQVELSARFDQRDSGWITSVKNQGELGACWSFSTMGALESRFIRLKKGTINLNLSEQNMATCHGFQAGINDGGSDFIAAAYLTRLSGPVAEASDPFDYNINATCGPGPFVIPAFTPRAVWLPKDIKILRSLRKLLRILVL